MNYQRLLVNAAPPQRDLFDGSAQTPMSDALFQEAYARARSRISEEAWLALHPRQVTEAIYREIREIDAERVAAIQRDLAARAKSQAPGDRCDSA